MGVQIKTNYIIGKIKSLDELLREDGFDAVIIAIGGGSNPLLTQDAPGLKTNKHGNIEAMDPETGLTAKAGVFAGGDIVTGAATVIEAMGAGKKAAQGIHEYVMNK